MAWRVRDGQRVRVEGRVRVVEYGKGGFEVRVDGMISSRGR